MMAREILARLVAFPTVSSASNLDCIAFVSDYLSRFGVESRLVPSPDGSKANLYATIGPAVRGGVVLSGHTDVVPVDGQDWASDPFRLTERDGRLFGRGVCDMKGFDALVLAAVPHMVRAPLKRPVHLALSYDEEVGCLGAPAMVAEMAQRLPPPAAVIVGEPTRFAVVNGHKGSLSFFTRVRGHSVHSSRIDQGISAVMVAARLVTWLDDVMASNRATADVASPFAPPYTTLHCGMINGGTAANIVAAECTFVSDIRAVPNEDPWSYKARYEAFIREMVEPSMRAIAPWAGVDVTHRSFVPGLRPEAAGTAEALATALVEAGRTEVVSYGTEAGLFQQAGWSTIVCGPGDIAQAHQADEFLEVAQFEAGEKFMAALIGSLCG
ncbi:acetylornithine deacetylase [Microvirga calopogonii]|uniref:acetylornithine deacetylase n=1 Tax=Microvirga calopogonii TaxID=2078013 RepID=UPI000E0D1935|nr:acetylornithine deacetylase [Microvirga calopogonii]